jgi:hypothetical protein
MPTPRAYRRVIRKARQRNTPRTIVREVTITRPGRYTLIWFKGARRLTIIAERGRA